jgi:murein L,D-transpeptidase YcbB/YkuD
VLLAPKTPNTEEADAHLGLQVGPSVRAFYGEAPQPVWTAGSDSLNPTAATALGLLADAAAYGLRPPDYGGTRLPALRDSLRRFPAWPRHQLQQAQFELYLSDALLHFMLDLYRGRLRAQARSPREKRAKQPFEPASALRAGLAKGQLAAAVQACQPPNREYQQLQAALAQRLHAPPPVPDTSAQWRAQNEQIALNLERWRWEAIPDAEYVLINIPAFTLQVVRGGQVVQQHRVIVGKPETPTPTLSSAISHFTTAPDWHVPRSIALKEILPALRKNPDYLARNNMVLYSERGAVLNPRGINWHRVTPVNFTYTIRQSAGCDNSLGNIVFRFANPYSIYLHDTPFRDLFAIPGRALSSHGCIRLQQPLKLAAYLLRRDGSRVQLPSEAAFASQQVQSRDYRLKRPMPLYVRYATCSAEAGKLTFYADSYQRDGVLRRALFPAAPARAQLN